jgi:hypothetical protein
MERQLVCLLGFVLASVQVFAQGALWGTQFLVSFGTIAADVHADSLYVYVVSSNTTTCRVRYTSCRDGHTEERILTLTKAKSSFRVGIPRVHVEQPYGRTPCGIVELQADVPIQVTAFVNDSLGGEATAVIPTALYGKTYVVPLTVAPENEHDTTSIIRATIIAAAASDVLLTAGQQPLRINGVSIGPSEQHRLFLEAGEQCLVETVAIDTGISQSILVQSSQPVAVVMGGRSGRQMYFEQLLAAEYWDTTALALRYPQPAGSAWFESDYVIVAAIGDSTVVRTSDGLQIILGERDAASLPVEQTQLLTASQPILVLIHRRGGDSTVGAGCLALAPPLNAAVKTASILSPQIREGVFRLYSEQYVTIAADSAAIDNLRFDGAPWSASWEGIPGSKWYISSRRTGDDVHDIIAAGGQLISWAIGYGGRRAYATCGDYAARQFPYLHARFRINSDTISTRDTFTVRIDLGQLQLPPALLRVGPPSRLRARLRWNATVATPMLPPLQPSIENGYHVEWIEARADDVGFSSGEPVAELRLLAALGEVPSFRIEIDSVLWFDGVGNVVTASFEQEGGLFVFNDIWRDQWGVRLVSPNAESLSLQVVPNPVESDAVIIFTPEMLSEQTVIELYTATGEKVWTVVLTAQQSTSGRIPFVRGALPSGVYFLRGIRGRHSVITTVVLQ